ncbi:MAG: WbqC family protein, partial [candidate division WOR-3 bacterium]
WVMSVLDLKVPIIYSSSLKVEGTSTERLVNICRAVGADKYLSGPGGRNYMDLSLFEQEGIKVVWQEFTHPVYEQVFPQVGFLPNLSIVDVLFCCGPETRKFLE